MKKTILFVPGFVADTYSEIEKSFVELSAQPDPEIQYLWLVQEISAKGNTFAREENRTQLSEPAYVPHLREQNLPFIVGNISTFNVFSNFLLFRKIFRENQIDGVYTHFGYERFWATLFAKLWGKKTIWNEHWHSLGRRFALLKTVFYRLFVDEFISISKFISGTLPHKSRIHTIPNAIHVGELSRKSPAELLALRKRLGLPEAGIIVLMVAAFRVEKRHFLALEVCQRVLQQRRDVTFVFLGDGELRGSFLANVVELGLSQYVLAPGYVDDVNDYYIVSDISILTSHFEPFGYVVLEAMRHALPVVVFDTGGPAEVINSGETGFLVKDADVNLFSQRLLELIESEPLRATVGENARESVRKKFNRESWVRELNKTIKEIVTGNGLRCPGFSGHVN